MGHLGEHVMGVDENEEHPAPIGGKLETAGHLVREACASFLVVALVRGLPCIVEK